uniref:Resistin-like beta n=1 Tax=Leptobrachium leishanense TaxID=445787 RepID=A0A8C5QHM0_9ANUR
MVTSKKSICDYTMKVTGIIIIISLGSVLTSGYNNECCLSDLVSMDNLLKSLADKIAGKIKLACFDVHEKTDTATCPEGSTPSSCTCGMACGSWDIRSGTTCHCQCENMDWTTARCCKTAVKN